MTLRCQLLVSDLVGTTLEDDGAVEASLAEAVRRHGVEWQPAVFADLRGRTKIEAISGMLAAQQRDPAAAAEIHETFVDLLIEHYRGSALAWVAGAEAAFRELAAQGIRLVLATGFPAEVRDVVADRVPWRDCLSAFLSGDDVARGRPAPDLVLEAMRRSGISDAGRVAVVGDTPADVASGRAAQAGLVLAVTSGACTAAVLEQARPDVLIKSVAELPHVLRTAANAPST